MSVQPIPLARDADGHPWSALYNDIYASRDGAAAQARHVFLGGSGLPGAWRERDQFVVLETGFGLGTNFLATWQAWRDDGARCRRLHFVSVEKHPLPADALLSAAPPELRPLAQLLARQWPLPVEGLHRLEFEGGGVVLTLALGDVRDIVPQLVMGADAIFLDGFAPDRNPQMWEPVLLKAVARCARAGATLATWCTARAVRDALAQAGFELVLADGFGHKRHRLTGRYAPRWRTRRHEPPHAWRGERSALIVGAGLAGSACAHALVRRGWQVRVLDAMHVAAGASGLPWGLLHPHYAVDDAPLARLMRAGVAATHAALARVADGGNVDDVHAGGRAERKCGGVPVAHVKGLLQMAPDDATFERWQRALAQAPLPAAYVELLDAGAAAQRIGCAPRRGGLWWPQGAVVSPARLCRVLLAGARVDRERVHQLAPVAGSWQARGADGRLLAEAPVAIVACALAAPALLGTQRGRILPVRGRIAKLADDAVSALHTLRAPISGDGYLLRDPEGGAWLGSTFEVQLPSARCDAGDDPQLTDGQALRSNLGRLGMLLAEPPPARATIGFDGLRCVSRDRLPLAGAVADEEALAARAVALRGAHLQDVPRSMNLYASYALGARGIALAPLLGELIAARIEGEPLPVTRDLDAAVDAARFSLQALRHGRLARPPET